MKKSWMVAGLVIATVVAAGVIILTTEAGSGLHIERLIDL